MTIRWILEKKDSKSNIGVTFGGPSSENSNDIHPVFIWTVKGGRMKKIDICPGLRVSKICDKWVRNAEHANRIVKFAPEGPIAVETYGKYYPVDKTSKDDKAGIALQMTKFPLTMPNGIRTVQEIVEITKVNPEGMFPEVTAGHIMWGINGAKITGVKQAVYLLRKKKTLRLVVLDPATLDATVKSVVSTPSKTPKPISSEPTTPSEDEEKDEDQNSNHEMPSSPIMTVMEKSFDIDEDLSSVHDDETSFVEGDEELETGPALWC